MTVAAPALTSHEVALVRYPTGLPSQGDFALRTAPVRAITAGEVLLRIRWISLDPAMRTWSSAKPGRGEPLALGSVMRAYAVAEVVESRHRGHPVGSHVVGPFGMRTWHVTDGSDIRRIVPSGSRPLTTALGELGHIGLTAYTGLVTIAQTQPGDTVVVTSAAGAVGIVALQIARNLGCRVIGIAGGPEKTRWLAETYGIQTVLDRHDDDLAARLAEVTPDGVDVFFDNTGGVLHDLVMERMATGGRVAISGTIAVNSVDPGTGPRHERLILDRALTVRGFLQSRHEAEAPLALEQLGAWYDAGELSLHVHTVTGLEQAIPALEGLLAGEYHGKVLINPVVATTT